MNAVQYFQTDDMIAAVRSLAERHHSVLVLQDYKSVRPIRMRTDIAEFNSELVYQWKPGVDRVVERWRKKGGILQFRSTPTKKHPECPVADAIFFIECPMQWDRFEHTCQSARREVVVYRPPTWSLHELTVDHLFPRREVYEMLEAFIAALNFADPDEYIRSAVWLSNFNNPVGFTADDLRQLTGWNEKFIRYVLRKYWRVIHRWHIYTTRLRPEYPEMLWAYELLREQPKVALNKYALRVGETRPRTLGFKSALKQLIYRKYVSEGPCVYVVDGDRRAADLDVFDAVNTMRRGRWYKLRNFVDQLEEYQT